MPPVKINREELNDFLQEGDAIINCSDEALATVMPALSVNSDGTARLIQGPAYPVAGDASRAIESLAETSVKRFVVICSSNNGQQYAEALKAAGVEFVSCIFEQACNSDAFMDEEDAEAVAERLRQLGYL